MGDAAAVVLAGVGNMPSALRTALQSEIDTEQTLWTEYYPQTEDWCFVSGGIPPAAESLRKFRSPRGASMGYTGACTSRSTGSCETTSSSSMSVQKPRARAELSRGWMGAMHQTQ